MKIIYTTTFITTLAFIVVLAGGALAQVAPLSGPQWKPVELAGRPVEDSTAFIRFGSENDRFVGSTGCNRIAGAVEFDNSKIKFSAIAMTKRLCQRGRASVVEMNIRRALARATAYRVNGDFLNLYSGRRLAMRLRADYGRTDMAEPGLGDRKWMLDAIGSKQVGRAGDAAFLNFDVIKGSAGGNTSCNVFGGNFKTTGDKIQFSGIISTMRACIEDAKMNIEREFLEALRRTDRYDIKGGDLYLYRGREILLMFRGTPK